MIDSKKVKKVAVQKTILKDHRCLVCKEVFSTRKDLHLKYNQDTTGESFTKAQLQNKYNNYKKELSKAKSKRTQSFKKTGRIHM